MRGLGVCALIINSSCAVTLGTGLPDATPDALPRVQKASVRGPITRDGVLLLGAELASEVPPDDDVFRLRRSSLLGGVRLRSATLGVESPALELAGAIGLGRGTFDPGLQDFGPSLGGRLDVAVPLASTPSASSSRVRAIFFRPEVVPYLHTDAIGRSVDGGRDVRWEAEAGVGFRAAFGSDMTFMDVFRQVF